KIDKDLADLLEVLRTLALANKDVPMIGRTHGIHAEPVTAGLFFAHYYDEFRRHRERFNGAAEEMRAGKLSGAVGTYAYGSPEREAKVLKRLGLEPAAVTTQIIHRERHANYLNVIALIGATVEKLSLNIRHHQRTEVSEMFEPFGRGQKGSSAMPHKRNPVLSENLCGLARLLRSYAMTGLENVALWHERDISHSSAERIVFPDATILLDFMLARLDSMLKGLAIKPEKMRENLERYGGVIFSEGVLSLLIRKGLKRQEAYRIVQRNALKAIETGGDFAKLLMEDDDAGKFVSPEEINETIDAGHSLRNIDAIFKRIFG
ncbi:MAG: adenylosuccinate lyase, partial [Deltaproteobacteria bacterium]|nr:adenylosuccinate lyase [Deltaproteobacteria bacterium]